MEAPRVQFSHSHITLPFFYKYKQLHSQESEASLTVIAHAWYHTPVIIQLSIYK